MNIALKPEHQRKIIADAEILYPIIKEIYLTENKMERSVEHLWVVGLDREYRLMFVELVALGQSNRVAVKPGDIFRMAIYKMAERLVIIHNHPSGDLTPSEEDVRFTKKMQHLGEELDIRVSDHLIISEDDYRSLDGIEIY